MADLATRFPQNPLIGPSDITPSQPELKVECVMNPGVFHFDNKTWLVLRIAERPCQKSGKVSFPVLNGADKVETIEFDQNSPLLELTDPRYVIYNGESYLSTISHLRLVCSDDGVHFHEPDDYPTMLRGLGDLESFGIEDCRVTEIEGTFYLTYTEVSASGVGVGLMQTDDWKNINRRGMIFPPHNKDCAIFDERINGKYYCMNRPSGLTVGGHYMWLSTSDDLTHWGEHKCILHTREDSWDCERVGAGASPIKTPEGWLVIYHGADADHRYCLGALLLDLKDPTIVLARTTDPIMEPVMQYEKEGFFGNVIFTNGHLIEDDKIEMYYGASDTVICGATFSISQLLSVLRDAE